MQDIENTSTNLDVRVYPPGVRRSGEKICAVQQACDDTSDITEDNHAASSYKIDLPFQDLQTKATQTLGQNSIILPLPSVERKSTSYDACEFQSNASSALLIHNGYSEMKNVLSDMKILHQDSQPKVCRNEVQSTDGYPSGPTRVIYAFQNTVGLEHKDDSHTTGSTTSMKKKLRNSERKKPPNTINRPQHQIIKFLEDYAEFGADLKEIFEGRGKHCPTVLESTVDGSIVKGARRSYGPRSSSSIDAATQSISSHQDSLISLDKCGLKTEQHKYKCSMCEVSSRNRQDVEEHITAVGNLHSKAVVLVLLGSQARGQNCPICNIRFTRLQLFKHIRSAHRDCFPLRCGYCVFFGQDYYQLRHHIRKKHGTSRYHIIDMLRLTAGEEVTGDEPERKSLVCPLCRKSLKTLSNLKKHITQHSRKKQQCGHCSFVTTFPTQIRSHYRRMHPSQIPQWQTILLGKGSSNFLVEDVSPYMKLITEKYGILKPKEKGKLMRQYRCPHCEYTCSFNSSYNRHLRLHSGAKPYKCGHCDFHAREAYIIKKHCSTAHKGRDTVIENDRNFKAPYRYGAFSRDEEAESSRYLQKEKEIICLKTHKKSTYPEPQKAKLNSTSAPQSDNKPQIKKTCGNGKSWTDESVSEHQNYSQNIDLRDKQNKTHSNVAVLKPQLCSSLNQSPSNKDIPLNTENWVPDELQSNSIDGILLTSSVDHLHLQSATQDLSLKGSHELEMVKQNITCCNSVEDEQSLRNISSVDNKSVSLVHLPVKVRTVKKHNPPYKVHTIEYVPDRQCGNTIHSVDNDVQKDGTSSVSMQPSTVMRLEERLSSTACKDPLTDMEEKTVLIYLQESGSGDLFIDKVKKIIHKCNPNRVIHSSSNNENLSSNAPGPQRMKKSSKVHSVIERGGENATHGKCNWSLRHVSRLRQADESIQHNTFKGLLNRRMESNFNNHISYFSDMQVQCYSNYNVATPEILRCDQQDGSYTNNDYYSTHKVRTMMQKEDGRVKCRKCGITTTYRAFYKHAKKHFNIKPFKCGYCSYRSIEKSKVRVHNTFCHPSQPPIILKLSPESAGIGCKTSSVCEANIKEKVESRGVLGMFDLGECKKLHKDDFRDISHSSNIFSLNAKPTVVSSSKQAVFQCIICSKILQRHTPSVRRHLYSHYSYKPYKCGYCSYTGIGQSEIRAHHVIHGLSVPPKIEDSGVPMPSDLLSHINNIFPFHRGTQPNQKEKECVGLQELVYDDTETGQGADIWKESSDTVKDITTVHISSQNDTEENTIFSNDQKSLEACGATCSLPQVVECNTLLPESAYAVQVVENLENAASSNSLSSQLNPGSVCVVYLID